MILQTAEFARLTRSPHGRVAVISSGGRHPSRLRRVDICGGQGRRRGLRPLRRLGRPEDIADIVAFLASDEARGLTGQTLLANGGLVTTAATIMVYGQPPQDG